LPANSGFIIAFGMGGPIREKHHRLPSESYRGNVIVAFTINTANRIPYFDHLPCVTMAAAALAESFEKHGGRVGVYVFMPDHLHLMVSGQDQQSDLLAMIKDFKQKTTFRLRKGRHAFGWQKDFYDHIVRKNEDYGAQVRYLLRNPVRRGLCEHWQDWPHKGVLGQTWEQLAISIATL
jgi:putative transposase